MPSPKKGSGMARNINKSFASVGSREKRYASPGLKSREGNKLFGSDDARQDAEEAKNDDMQSPKNSVKS